MKSELANQLKNLLDNMSKEEFDRQWSEITAIGFNGPSFTDILEFDAIKFQGEYEMLETIDSSFSATPNHYNLAA